MPDLYVVNDTEMDAMRVPDVAGVTWRSAELGHGWRVVRLHTEGASENLQDGFVAVQSVYPAARATSLQSEATRWLRGEDDVSRGGARPGAGRPALAEGQETVRSTITLPASLDEKALRLGRGNRSEGIRRALAVCEEEMP